MDYCELVSYQKARAVTRGIHSMVKSWPQTYSNQGICRQLFRAASSIGANIAEGHGRHIGREYVHYLIIAQGSANEVDHWLHTAMDCGLGDTKQVQEIIQLNNETRRILAKTISTLSQETRKSLRETPDPYTPNPFTPLPSIDDSNIEDL